jgi:hypothetical protein
MNETFLEFETSHSLIVTLLQRLVEAGLLRVPWMTRTKALSRQTRRPSPVPAQGWRPEALGAHALHVDSVHAGSQQLLSVTSPSLLTSATPRLRTAAANS